jgi:integrase/recombinase XerC
MSPKSKVDFSFVEYVYLFLDDLDAVQHKSVHTIRCYTADLNNLKEFLETETFKIPLKKRAPRIHIKLPEAERGIQNDQIDLTKVERSVIRAFLRQLHANDASKRTISRHISSLRTFFKFAATRDSIEVNPMRYIEKPKVANGLTTYLTYEQIQNLLDQPNTSDYFGFRDRCMMEVLYSSALRVSELVGLNQEDVDFELLVITLKGKGRRERIVPITEPAAKWLSDLLSHPDRPKKGGKIPVFLNKFGERLSTRSVNRRLEIYLEAVGLKGKVTPHTIRHTIATHWLENGMDINTIKVLLGHKSFSTTTIYTRVTEKLKKESYDKAFKQIQP